VSIGINRQNYNLKIHRYLGKENWSFVWWERVWMLAMISLYAPSHIFTIDSKLAPATSYLKQLTVIFGIKCRNKSVFMCCVEFVWSFVNFITLSASECYIMYRSTLDLHKIWCTRYAINLMLYDVILMLAKFIHCSLCGLTVYVSSSSWLHVTVLLSRTSCAQRPLFNDVHSYVRTCTT